MKKHLIPILFMAGLLSAIVVLAFTDQLLGAKILGVVLVVSFTLYIRIWLRGGNKSKVFRESVSINTNDLWIVNEFLFWKELNSKQKKEFKKRLAFTVGQMKLIDWEKNKNAREDLLIIAFCAVCLGLDSSMSTNQKQVFVLENQENPEFSSIHGVNSIVISGDKLEQTRMLMKRSKEIETTLQEVLGKFFKN
jgi:hypothetical protein